MHEVALISMVWTRLRDGTDSCDPDIRAPHRETVERVVKATLKILGVPIQPDGSIVLADEQQAIRGIADFVESLEWRDECVEGAAEDIRAGRWRKASAASKPTAGHANQESG